MAPRANISNVKISDDTAQGQAMAFNVVAGLQWGSYTGIASTGRV